MLHSLDGVQIDIIDIEADPALYRLYGSRIPVLGCEFAERELNWPFSRRDVESFIDTCRHRPDSRTG